MSDKKPIEPTFNKVPVDEGLRGAYGKTSKAFKIINFELFVKPVGSYF